MARQLRRYPLSSILHPRFQPLSAPVDVLVQEVNRRLLAGGVHRVHVPHRHHAQQLPSRCTPGRGGCGGCHQLENPSRSARVCSTRRGVMIWRRESPPAIVLAHQAAEHVALGEHPHDLPRRSPPARRSCTRSSGSRPRARWCRGSCTGRLEPSRRARRELSAWERLLLCRIARHRGSRTTCVRAKNAWTEVTMRMLLISERPMQHRENNPRVVRENRRYDRRHDALESAPMPQLPVIAIVGQPQRRQVQLLNALVGRADQHRPGHARGHPRTASRDLRADDASSS